MSDRIRWGILGTGSIAHKFATGLAVLPDAALVAVGSRRQKTADAFGDEFDVPNRHAGDEALAADPDVDVVYVATPHVFHCDNTVLCLDHGKHVLCEKPFAINAHETRHMIVAARRNHRFLMAAVWTRFLPTMVKLREILASGRIGEVKLMQVDFGFRAGLKPEARLFNPALGGGALLDVGSYTVQLAAMVFGQPPAKIMSTMQLGETGVDEQTAMLFTYDQGQMAQLSCAIRTSTSQEASIFGTEGRIHFPSWWNGTTLTVWDKSSGAEGETMTLPFEGNGYNCEAQAVMECIRAGKLESEVMPLDETIQLMETLDTVRAQGGLRYPME